MKEKDVDRFSTFILSETTLNQIKALPPEMQLKFFWAVSNYGITGTEPDFTGVELAIWIPMRDLIRNSKRKNEKWLEKQRENGKKGGRPKTQNNPENPDKPTETHNGNENVNVNDNEFTPLTENEPEQDPPEPQSFPAALAADQKAIVLKSRPPPQSKKLELTEEQKPLFHTARLYFESSEKAKALIYQDKNTTKREMEHLKTLIIRCSTMAPGITEDFLQNVLEHFKIMTNGKLKGKAAFTPRALITPWIWELVIDSLPENNVTPEIYEKIKGMFG
jgi:hypothetical protein